MADAHALPTAVDLILREVGLVPAHVLRRAGLPASLLRRETPTVTGEEFHCLWTAIGEEGGDRPVGLDIGRLAAHEVLSPPLIAALASPDLTTAAHRLAQYKALIGPLRMDARETEEGLTLQMRGVGFALPPALALLEVAYWVYFARRATREPIAPRRIELPVRPPDVAAVEAELGCRIRTGPDALVRFSATDARRPFFTADAEAWRFYEPVLQERLADLEQSASLAERVHATLVEMLPSGRGAVDDVAEALALSPRSLQRHLRREGTTFQKTLARTREILARHYLRTPEISTTEVAFLLGYDDPNSFFRAFRSWTGTTPERARHAVATA
ncbi:MAG: AraC family transcriptional regulator ligand-binding domain-containing protein [Bacteroidota bacterium]